MNPGIYDSITNNEYHSGPGESKSLLDLARRSPIHYRAARSAANDNTRKPTAAQVTGTAFHALLLEPDHFAADYVLAPKFDRRTKDGKAGWEAFQAEHTGKSALDADDWDQLHAMRDAVMAHPAARSLMTGAKGYAEHSVYWRDPVTGLLCRCRPDWWREDGIVVDVKTTEDASAEAFARSIASWRYHVQAPFYLDGIATMQDQVKDPEMRARFPWAFTKPRAFLFLAVEKSARVVDGVALGVAVYALDTESMTLGRVEYRQDLLVIAECHRAGQWPGYGDRIQSLSLPQWKLAQNAHLLAEA